MTLCCLPRPVTTAWLVCALALPLLAWAHGGEDHSHADEASPSAQAATAAKAGLAGLPGSADASAPQRLPDGRLWVPKPVQHRLGLRTVVPPTGPQTVPLELTGRVLPDPQASGQVQASQAGRIEASTAGLPRVGQRVSQGQVLAWLRPVASSLERGNQQASLAELAGQLAQAEARVQRLAQLDGVVARKDQDAARTERDALRQRHQAVASSLSAPEALRAPVSGVLAASHVGLGQVVDAKDLLFEVVDPQRWLVEALLPDPALARQLGDASARLGPDEAAGTLDLQWLGASAQLREQTLPVWFKVRRASVPLVAGQSVQLWVTRRSTAAPLSGQAVPRSALVRSRAGEAAVWVHQAPEHFVQRLVRWQPLNAAQVLVTDGLHPGERVVHQGASLLAQIR